MNPQQIIKEIFAFMKEAGDFALEKQSGVTANLKPDQSIVTEADLAITKMFYDRFGTYIGRDDTAIIDEETKVKDSSAIENAKYIWSLDPIDGTTTYFNGLPLWGISLGIFKGGLPWIGVVYMPAMRELIYCDGENAFLIKEVFTDKQTEIPVREVPHEISTKDIVYIAAWLGHEYKYDTDFGNNLLDLYSYIVQLSYVALGRGKGCFFGAYLWDIAGIWPIAQKAGLGFFDMDTCEELNHFDKSRFKDNWRIGNTHIFCHKENFKKFENLVK